MQRPSPCGISVVLQPDEDRNILPFLYRISSANLPRRIHNFGTLNLSHLLLLQPRRLWQLVNPICNRRTRLQQDICNSGGDDQYDAPNHNTNGLYDFKYGASKSVK